MKDSTIKPEFMLHVFGDWMSLMSARDYHDELLEQVPNDEEQADYSRYTIRRDTADGLLQAYQVFRKLGLKCEFSVSIKSEETGVEAFATTGAGYGSKPPYFAEIRVDETKYNAEVAGAVQTALDALNKVRA